MTELKIEEATRQQVAEFLPCAIKKAFASYHDFMEATPDDGTAKKFKEQHTAGKAALAHIALLLELAGRVHVDMESLSKADPDLKDSITEYCDYLKREKVPNNT